MSLEVFRKQYEMKISICFLFIVLTIKSISYEIYFRSMIPDIESGISGVTFDYSDLIIRKDTSDAASLKKIAAVLPRTCDVSAESGAVFTIPVKGAWTVDQKAKCFRARADASKLPSNLSDPSGFLGSLKIPYVVKDTNDTRNSILSFSPNPAVNGDALRIGVTRCDLVYNPTCSGCPPLTM